MERLGPPTKNAAAQSLTKLRNQKLSPAQRKAIASKAGKGRLNSMTPAERSAAAVLANKARWARYRRDRGLPPKPGDENFL